MQAGAQQPTTVTQDRRIIERPRLIKLLDETDARTILLLAPAGYGKTTLARQWAKTLLGAVYLTLVPAHRDVAAFADDLARAVTRKARMLASSANTSGREAIHNARHGQLVACFRGS